MWLCTFQHSLLESVWNNFMRSLLSTCWELYDVRESGVFCSLFLEPAFIRSVWNSVLHLQMILNSQYNILGACKETRLILAIHARNKKDLLSSVLDINRYHNRMNPKELVWLTYEVAYCARALYTKQERCGEACGRKKWPRRITVLISHNFKMSVWRRVVWGCGSALFNMMSAYLGNVPVKQSTFFSYKYVQLYAVRES